MKNKNPHILVIETEKTSRQILIEALCQKGYEAEGVEKPERTVEKLKEGIYDLILLGQGPSTEASLAIVEKIKNLQPEAEIIMITGFSTMENAIEAMKHGIFDFVQKPYQLGNLLKIVEKALEKGELKLVTALYEASRLIFSSIKINDLLDKTVDQIQKVLAADACSIMLLNKKGKLSIASQRGMDPEIAKNVELEIGERVAGKAFKEGKPLLLIDSLERYAEFKGLNANHKISSSMVIPLISGNHALGVMNINRTIQENHFNQKDLRNATIFASQVGQAIQNAKLFEELEQKVEEVRQAHEAVKQAQHQLMASERLASIGRLVGGLSHEINNPLTAVIGYAQLLIDGQYKDNPEDKLRIIIREARRCEKIIQHLRTFAKVSRPHFERLNPCILLDECLEMMAGDIKKHGIRVEKKYPYPFPEMDADPAQLRQIFVNILSNAILALENQQGLRQIQVEVKIEENQLTFEFQDSGPGIPQEHLLKIFDPFFTTREVGKGTGLGLSLVFAMVEEHRGRITVSNVEAGGAKFTMIFSLGQTLSSGAKETKKTREVVSQTMSGFSKRVLVVEDEETVRDLLIAILSSRGYEVDAAEDGLTALERIQKRDYELVVCDFRLPKLNGGILYEKVKELGLPYQQRFLFVSGSAEMGDGAHQFFVKNALPFLPKPFSGEQLFAAIDKYFQTTTKAA